MRAGLLENLMNPAAKGMYNCEAMLEFAYHCNTAKANYFI